MMQLKGEGLVKIFRSRQGDHRAVDDVTISVEAGRFVAIVGESGSGKSTLARILLQLIRPDAGRIALDDKPVNGRSRADLRFYRSHVQAILQDPAGSLNPRKTVRNLLGEVARLHLTAASRREVDAVVNDALDRVGMSPPERFIDRYPHELSGGQRQRVLIARALIPKPQIIIADEAVSALDVSVKAGVLSLMQELQSSLGIGYAFITHDLTVVSRVAEYVYVMRQGRVIEEGETNRLFREPHDPYTIGLLDARLELDDVLAEFRARP